MAWRPTWGANASQFALRFFHAAHARQKKGLADEFRRSWTIVSPN